MNPKTIKDVSEDVTKTMMESYKENNKSLEILNDKLLEIKNDGRIEVTYLLSYLSKISNPGSTSEFELVKVPQSNRVNDLLINKTIPVTLYNNLLTLRGTDKKFELKGDYLKMVTNKNHKIDLATLSVKKTV